MIVIYWRIGAGILARQTHAEWGARIVEHLAADLGREFSETKGFSIRNLKYMRAFAAAWPDFQFVQQVVAQIPWNSQIALLDKISDAETRAWYARQALEQGWSRAILVHQIETRLHDRQGRAPDNFKLTMAEGEAAVAARAFKVPYVLDFT